MRARQLLTEVDHEQEIRDHLITLVTSLHANGVDSIGLDQLRNSLEDAGFFVTKTWLKTALGEIKVVKSVENNTVELDVESDQTEPKGKPDQARDEKTVSRMAAKALDRRI